jgi:hypothetical protein
MAVPLAGCGDNGLNLGPGEVLDVTGQWSLSFDKQSNPNVGCFALGLILTITEQQPGTGILGGDRFKGVTEGGEADCPGGPGPWNLSPGTVVGEVRRLEDFEGRPHMRIELDVSIPPELSANLIGGNIPNPLSFEGHGPVSNLLGRDVGIVAFTLERR